MTGMTHKAVELSGRMVPGTNQVKINPVVTMAMTLVTYVVTSFTPVNPPPEVWVALSGLISYGLQYWHGPRA